MCTSSLYPFSFFFFFNDTATTEIYTLSLHDALPILESMSNAPYLLAKARGGYRAGHDRIIDHMMMDGLEDAYETGRSMGDFGEATAEAYQFTRKDQDAYAMETLTRARKAVEGGAFSAENPPVTLTAK